jgi:Tol biopolymer transport system component
VARRKNREKLAWAVAGVFALAAIGLGIGFVRRAPGPRRTVRFEIPMPEGVATIDAPRISPDGRCLAFNATDSSGKTLIWVRALSDLAAHSLDGTDGARRPFWSPDSRYLAFVGQGKLQKIAVAGGPTQKICDAPTGSDGSWSPEGTILYDGTGSDPIYRVSAGGGTPVVAVKPDSARKETMVGWPEFLPDGRHFLYLATCQKAEDNQYRIGSLDSTETKALAPAQTLVSYAPPGYLLFVRDRTLMAQPFDVRALKTTGEAVPLAEHVGTDSVGLARFSVSREGTLVYRTGETGNRMVWLDPTGRELEAVGDPGAYRNPALSPAGDRLAFDLSDPRSGKFDIWVRDLKRGVNSRLTFGTGDSFCPLWTPDGRTIVFARDIDLYEKSADGLGEEKLLFKSDDQKIPCDWSRDGRTLIFMNQSKETGWDVYSLAISGDRKPVPFLKTSFQETLPVLSPDGRFLAYGSNESGRFEVYVQSFPGPGGKWQISTAGGGEPHWRSDGKELYYRTPNQKLMAVGIGTAGGFSAGVPQPLLSARFVTGLMRDRFLPTHDSKRFLALLQLGREAMTPTTVVLNWTAGLTGK